MAFSVAIRVDGELRDAPSELAPDAFFPIYSVTKTLTAICALRLAESGGLQLGEPARRWLPEVDIPATITLTHLLHHTSGLHDYGPLGSHGVPRHVARTRGHRRLWGHELRAPR